MAWLWKGFTPTMVGAPVQRLLHRATDCTFDGTVDALLSVATGEEVKVLPDIQHEKKKLEMQLETVKILLTDVEHKGLPRLGEKWLQELQDALCDAEDALDECATDAAVLRRPRVDRSGTLDSIKSEVRNYFSEMLKAYQFDKIRGRLEDLVSSTMGTALQVRVPASQPKHTPRPPAGYVLPYQEKLAPRDDALQKIMDWVQPLGEQGTPPLSILCVHGMGGIGKTTLARLVYNDGRVKGLFQLRMWVCVSDDFSVERVTKNIIKSCWASKRIRDPCSDTDLGALQQTLEQEVNVQNFLLVLDDVWEQDESRWKELIAPLAKKARGSRVLVTTRNERIAKMVMRGEKYEPLRLGGLSDEEISSIIRSNVSKEGIDRYPGKFDQFCSQIVEKLGGSPLAAKTLGRLIDKFGVEHLEKSHFTSELWNLEQGNSDILPILKISYDNLSPSSKECFAYCSLFP